MSITIGPQRALFERLIDYAGLFPPESLPMREAVAGYRRARAGPAGWMAGHFLCRSSQLAALAAELISTMEGGEAPWSISVVFDELPGTAAGNASSCHREMEPAAVVSLAEARIPEEALTGDVAAEVLTLFNTITSIEPQVVPYLEVPITEEWGTAVPAAIAAIAEARTKARRHGGAKLRLGGLAQFDFPTPEQVTGFLFACADHELPFKATAGLHHPVRHHEPELGVMRHGFLNLLAAAALVEEGASPGQVTAVLADEGADAFTVTAAGFRWRERRISSGVVFAMRSRFFSSFGSCSFAEPVGDLAELGMLAIPAAQ